MIMFPGSIQPSDTKSLRKFLAQPAAEKFFCPGLLKRLVVPAAIIKPAGVRGAGRFETRVAVFVIRWYNEPILFVFM